jgi:hypothetical protein
MFRYSFERAVKLDYYRDKNRIRLQFPHPYLILLEEAADVEDKVVLAIEIPRANTVEFNIDVIRYWTYDLKKLYEENKYLIYPLQIFKLRRKMDAISSSTKSESIKREKMLKLYGELKELIFKSLEAIDKAYKDGKIEKSDYDEMTIVLENINLYLLNVYGKYGIIEEEVKMMVKSFYDPEVEARGRELERISIAENIIKDGEPTEKIKKYTGLDEASISEIRKMTETKGKH